MFFYCMCQFFSFDVCPCCLTCILCLPISDVSRIVCCLLEPGRIEAARSATEDSICFEVFVMVSVDSFPSVCAHVVVFLGRPKHPFNKVCLAFWYRLGVVLGGIVAFFILGICVLVSFDTCPCCFTCIWVVSASVVSFIVCCFQNQGESMPREAQHHNNSCFLL